SYLTTSWVIRQALKANLVGIDVNKPDRPKVPLYGGIGPIAGFVSGSFVLLPFVREDGADVLEAVLLSSLIIAFLGMLDDIFNVRQSIRAFTPVFAAVPLAVFSVGHTTISVPFLGYVNFGPWYYIVILPAALTIAANAFNMLEGLNGLGAGMGVIMTLTLALIGFRAGGLSLISGEMAVALLASLIAFLIFNKYPAKVFPGNVGTYFIGAAIGALGISGYTLTALFFLYLPYVAEFVLKARTKFKGVSFGKVSQDGTLYWDSFPHSLTHVVMKLGRFKEYQVVLILWGIEAVFAVMAYFFQVTIIKL
ncbi:MAG: UDP-N-acetylglucosamine--dolichyl-phosphate N-acetylglucosaminephosphotransferase, partial [Sulfolobales archaeon]|nr:UDP-N-acetylglucosamine--dolichyl-phosphate N-acetylglucosaminephosphotransferase [Sulfolobales archaeon]